MDNARISSFFFFVPNRLVWDNWPKFMGQQDNPGDSTDYQIPTTTAGAGGFNEGSWYDSVGLPIGIENITISALPQRGYREIYDEWFRDENLQNSLLTDKGDGPDAPTNSGLVRRGKRKDYISSCLPWPQKGPASEIPLGTTAPVTVDLANATSLQIADPAGSGQFYGLDTGTSAGDDLKVDTASGLGPQFNRLVVDLSSATGATINDWREAFQIQKLKERDARGGTRYTEIIQSHFRVISPDARLQRPEYLGGGVSPITMRSVPQTSSTDATTPQGNLSAYAEGHVQDHGFTKSFVEHGYIIGMVSIQTDLNYQNRVDRHWSRSTKYDFYWPALQALGEQPVYNREVWVDGTANDDLVWGYQERWAEYRTMLGVIAGRFRSAATGTLDPWHYALDFVSRPALNSTFVEDVPPIKRTIAVQGEPEFLVDAWLDIKAARPMPVYSVPGYIDHF